MRQSAPAGYFLVEGLRLPLGEADYSPSARLPMPQQKLLHGFSWLRDLAAAAPRETAARNAEMLVSRWLDGQGEAARGPAWSVERAGERLLAWLVHAPLVLSGDDPAMRPRMLRAIEQTARWLDRNAGKEQDRLAAPPVGRESSRGLAERRPPRHVFGEAGLLRAGRAVSRGGGCCAQPVGANAGDRGDRRHGSLYAAVRRTPPPALQAMLQLLVPPLLALRHGDGGLGSWQGAGAVSAHTLARLIAASGVRTRPARDTRHWGYQVVAADKSVLQFDAAPPPRPRDARFGCASSLAFELSHGASRIVVNCGGAELAGGATPARISRGCVALGASTLTLDDANSNRDPLAVRSASGSRRLCPLSANPRRDPARASHDGYACVTRSLIAALHLTPTGSSSREMSSSLRRRQRGNLGSRSVPSLSGSMPGFLLHAARAGAAGRLLLQIGSAAISRAELGSRKAWGRLYGRPQARAAGIEGLASAAGAFPCLAQAHGLIR